ncbi:hypothetical protein QFZ20_001412 [Flavobacterium sp. W4I14]|nr:hypothetical protein [Flavobacterium sp. W4I14]
MKRALLEFIIRNLMLNCGFTSVRPDANYIFQQNGTGLFFINGKGAAHDADGLMEPPILMPFSYPSRLLFVCKAMINNWTGFEIDYFRGDLTMDAIFREFDRTINRFMIRLLRQATYFFYFQDWKVLGK